MDRRAFLGSSIGAGLIAALAGSGLHGRAAGTVVPYPRIDALAESDRYQVTVNGQTVWTETHRSNMDLDALPRWFIEPHTSVQQEVHLAGFAGEGTLDVTVKAPGPIRSAIIRPLSRKIQGRIDGHTLRFRMAAPDHLYLEIDGLPALCLFADPIEQGAPSPGDPKVRSFGPGVHRPGLITLTDDETLYLAAGAVVYGGIRADGARNIRVVGRGILDGAFEHRDMVRIENCRNVHVEGLTIRNGINWTNTLVRCDGVVYQDVKVVSFGPSGDGINPVGCRNVRIRNCFLRCTDDCIAVKTPADDMIAEDIRVDDTTMVGYAFADGFTIGFETNGPTVKDITVRNCDVLLSRGGSRVDGHSAFSIVCDGPAVISGILFEDIRVERAEEKLFELIVTDGTKYQDDPPGHIRDITVRNVSWLHEGPISLQGFSREHMVRQVVFEDCSVGGRPLSAVKDRVLQVNAFVEGVTVRDRSA